MVEWARSEPKWPNVRRSAGNGTIFLEFADELLKEPGRWAVYPGKYVHDKKTADNIAYQINTNRRTTLPARKFEARADVRHKVWVRARPKPTRL